MNEWNRGEHSLHQLWRHYSAPPLTLQTVNAAQSCTGGRECCGVAVHQVWCWKTVPCKNKGAVLCAERLRSLSYGFHSDCCLGTVQRSGYQLVARGLNLAQQTVPFGPWLECQNKHHITTLDRNVSFIPFYLSVWTQGVCLCLTLWFDLGSGRDVKGAPIRRGWCDFVLGTSVHILLDSVHEVGSAVNQKPVEVVHLWPAVNCTS